MEKILEVEGLTKLYKNGRGVRNISFSIEKGDVVGLLGPNGSGKTTIMKTIMGLTHGSEHSVTVFGHDVERDVETTLKKVGGLIERPAIFEQMSALDNLRMMARYYPGVDAARIQHVLEVVRISQYQKEKCGKFSLGMKQRLGLALAILSDPELVILDEPTNGLDIEGTVEVREIIKRMAAEKGTSFLIASHLAPEIEKTCNKVAIVHDGEMLSFEPMGEALRFNPTLEDYFLSKVKDKRGSVLI
ncbi:ATP-binding cassette domain-containing protein [Aminipila butyrica]|uniref:ATP-binding cassette domain-containing protein n=1 Tax=Aminipila butyrica TaxID=433296 RepID=A0A858BRH2_9FIRM|nr:ATP-binding cassette domain-containing protein [Aminipila butyrica]QIB68531.1 ATP-binding cassette domain-containing protein [Aminipila butyrica]